MHLSTVVSVINLKGGVGKTQLTVALAEFLAIEHNPAYVAMAEARMADLKKQGRLL